MSQGGGRGAGRAGVLAAELPGQAGGGAGVRAAPCVSGSGARRPAWGPPRGAPSPGGRWVGHGEAWGQLRILAVSG